MKNVLFASTALVAFGFAGAAFAEAHASTSISLSGSAELGFTSIDDGAAQDGRVQLHNDFDLVWSLTGMTDGGIAFGATGDWDEAPTEESAAVFISGSFGTITVGDTDGAYDKAMIEVSSAGLADEADFYINGHSGLDGQGDAESQVGRYDLAFGGTTLSVSYEDGKDDAGTGAEDIYGIGAAFSLGSVSLGLGYQYTDNIALAAGDELGFDGAFTAAAAGNLEDVQVAGISAGLELGVVAMKLAYEYATGELDTAGTFAGSLVGDDFESNQVEVSATANLGAGTIGANYSTAEVEVGAASVDVDGYGIWYTMSLGGGATFTAAAGQQETDGQPDETRFGAGIGMSF